MDEALAGDVLGRVAGLRERLGEWLDTAGYRCDDELEGPVRAYLGGEADPVGAAATLVLLSDTDVSSFYEAARPRGETRYDGLADAWTVEHGLAFAASAFIELSEIGPCTVRSDLFETSGVRRSFAHSMDFLWETRQGGVRRMRELLTAADETVLDRLGELRATPLRRIIVSYLAPDRVDWLDECIADPATAGWARKASWMLWCCPGSAAEVERARDALHAGRYEPVPDVLATIYAAGGPALVPVLAARWTVTCPPPTATRSSRCWRGFRTTRRSPPSSSAPTGHPCAAPSPPPPSASRSAPGGSPSPVPMRPVPGRTGEPCRTPPRARCRPSSCVRRGRGPRRRA
ncbi:hypothetical protein [Actinomadura sp. CNU-125]|uniref:hypothetical protein n=1 Tax=Actinomadura sp. CNU-125 TaxID=1904961 RepID=UPI000A6A0710|nr:hypothetical protein [Actinomadura sp. CNU-125]